MERPFDEKIMHRFYYGTMENNLEEVKKIVEAGDVDVDKYACMDALRHGSYDVLQYFMQKNNQIDEIWSIVIQDAVCHRNFPALKIMFDYFKNHREEFSSVKVEGVILKVLASEASSSDNAKECMTAMRAIINLYLPLRV